MSILRNLRKPLHLYVMLVHIDVNTVETHINFTYMHVNIILMDWIRGIVVICLRTCYTRTIFALFHLNDH